MLATSAKGKDRQDKDHSVFDLDASTVVILLTSLVGSAKTFPSLRLSMTRHVCRENKIRPSFQSSQQSSDDDRQKRTYHSARFLLRSFYVHTMRTSLSCLKLCLLFCSFAQGVGHTRAVQRALLRTPDAASAVDGFPTLAPSHHINYAVLCFRRNER